MRQVVLVADVRGWAFDSVAQGIKAELPNTELLYSEDYSTHVDLLDDLCNLVESGNSVVHFMWRLVIRDLLQESEAQTLFEELRSKAWITTHVPDHQFLDGHERAITEVVIGASDGYFVVSEKLMREYTDAFPRRKPWGVLHDKPANWITQSVPNTLKSESATLNCLWVGNSTWGLWQGKRDYKGLHSIVWPAINRVSASGMSIRLSVIDAAEKRVPSNVVLEAMTQADVLLIASENEGTPLPALEAASLGRALVSTNVGVVAEFAGPLQRRFIVARSPEAFAAALGELCVDRDLLLELQNENSMMVERYREKLEKESFASFIASVTTSRVPREPLPTAEPSLTAGVLNKTRSFINRHPTLKSSVVTSLARWPKMEAFLADTFAQQHVSLSASQGWTAMLSRDLQNRTIALYDERWLGVAHATKSIFAEAHPFPNGRGGKPGFTSLGWTKQAALDLADLNPEHVVVSGGELRHLHLLRELRRRRPSIRLSLLWHGSPTQLSDPHHAHLFNSWIGASRDGIIDALNVVKEGFDVYLRHLGIESFLVWNVPPPNQEDEMGPLRPHFTSGILITSPASSLLKNVMTQIVAAQMVPNEPLRIVTDSKLPSWIVDDPRVSLSPPLSPSVFRRAMVEASLVMYVTLSECAPMVPLEALSLGSPFISGPSIPYLNDYQELRKLVVVDNPDSIIPIVDRASDVLSATDTYRKLAHHFTREYTNRAFNHNANIYGAAALK